MRKVATVLGWIAIITLVVFVIVSCDEFASGNIGYTGERIGLIHIDGVITTSKAELSPFATTGASSESIVEQIDEAKKDKNVKGIVIRVNSPGGSAAGSQEIFNAIKDFRQSGRKIIISMGDVAASGGYFVAAPADIIYANPATLTGSIGVIMQLLNYEGLFDLVGLDEVTLKAGKFKDIGNPNRPITAEEKALLQNIIDEVHSQFKEAVMEGRGMTEAEVNKIATGEIWSGRQAKELGLVDELGGLKDALDRAAQEAGLNVNDYVVSPLGEGTIFDELLKGFEMKVTPVIQITDSTPGGNYLYLNQLLLNMTMR